MEVKIDNNRTVTVSVLPFESKILGADKRFVYVKGEREEELDEEMWDDDWKDREEYAVFNMPQTDSFDCILKIPIKEYLRICKLWIKSKAETCYEEDYANPPFCKGNVKYVKSNHGEFLGFIDIDSAIYEQHRGLVKPTSVKTELIFVKEFYDTDATLEY